MPANAIKGISFNRREFETLYSRELELARKLYESTQQRTTRADLHDFDHYVNVAAYLHTINADKPTIFAGFFHFLAPYKNQYKGLINALKAAGHDRGDAKYVTYILDKYNQIREHKGIDINANMVLHMKSPDQRASIMRAVDIMLNFPDRISEDRRNKVRLEDSFARLIEDIYLPITYALSLHKLHHDLGYQLMSEQHPKRLKQIEDYKNSAWRQIKYRGNAFIQILQRKLEEIGLKRDIHYTLMQRPTGYFDPAVGEPVKSAYSVHQKMLGKLERRALHLIPDWMAWRIVLRTFGWTDSERLNKLKEIDDLIRRDVGGVVHQEITSYLNDHPRVEVVDAFANRERSFLGYQAVHYPIAASGASPQLSGAELHVTTDEWHDHNETGPANAVFGRAPYPPEMKAALTALSNYIKAFGLPSKTPFSGMLESPVHVQYYDAQKDELRVISLPEGCNAIDLFARIHEREKSPPQLPRVLINGIRSSLGTVLSANDVVQFAELPRGEEKPHAEQLLKEAAYLLSTKRFLVQYLSAARQLKYRSLRRP